MIVTALAFASDPLFDLMPGRWHGEGSRTQLASGRVTRLETDVETRVDGERLVSRSRVTETPATGGEPRTYRREYWIRPSGSGRYELGKSDKPNARGELLPKGPNGDGRVLTVEQELGGGYAVRSETTFEGAQSRYDEIFSAGGRELSRTLIRYERR